MGLISAASTIFDAGAMAAGFGGGMTFIKKLTASSSANLSFVDGSSGVVLDSTFKELNWLLPVTVNWWNHWNTPEEFNFKINGVLTPDESLNAWFPI